MSTDDKVYLKRSATFSGILFIMMGIVVYSLVPHPPILPILCLSVVVGFVLAGLEIGR